ncbi:MAG: hypothetical protein PHG19_12455 [Anaerotignum sp.]|nr:hypothetical protein [Anaerotignum sp.]
MNDAVLPSAAFNLQNIGGCEVKMILTSAQDDLLKSFYFAQYRFFESHH